MNESFIISDPINHYRITRHQHIGNSSPPSYSTAQQWAYNMASHECDLRKQGKSKEEAKDLTLEKYYEEYRDLILEYGANAYVAKLFELCPEFMIKAGGRGGSNSSSNKSECSLDSSEIYDISRGMKVTTKGKNCFMSFN